MNVLNATELDIARALARLTVDEPTEEQRELARELLAAFSQKILALETLSLEYVKLKSRFGSLQAAVGEGLAASMRPVQTSGPSTGSDNTGSRSLRVVRPEVDRG